MCCFCSTWSLFYLIECCLKYVCHLQLARAPWISWISSHEKHCLPSVNCELFFFLFFFFLKLLFFFKLCVDIPRNYGEVTSLLTATIQQKLADLSKFSSECEQLISREPEHAAWSTVSARAVTSVGIRCFLSWSIGGDVEMKTYEFLDLNQITAHYAGGTMFVTCMSGNQTFLVFKTEWVVFKTAFKLRLILCSFLNLANS